MDIAKEGVHLIYDGIYSYSEADQWTPGQVEASSSYSRVILCVCVGGEVERVEWGEQQHNPRVTFIIHPTKPGSSKDDSVSRLKEIMNMSQDWTLT